jgi:hypothetical protein
MATPIGTVLCVGMVGFAAGLLVLAMMATALAGRTERQDGAFVTTTATDARRPEIAGARSYQTAV